ncbi:MAG: hypothetical protein KAI79_12815 [Bacteroidales bacterium]|nr:hypothetical protein [Bacteroidales bacterium]
MNKTRVKKLEEKIHQDDAEPIEIRLDFIAMDKSIVKSFIMKDGVLCPIDHD